MSTDSLTKIKQFNNGNMVKWKHEIIFKHEKWIMETARRCERKWAHTDSQTPDVLFFDYWNQINYCVCFMFELFFIFDVRSLVHVALLIRSMRNHQQSSNMKNHKRDPGAYSKKDDNMNKQQITHEMNNQQKDFANTFSQMTPQSNKMFFSA